MAKNLFEIRETLENVAKQFAKGNGFVVKQILRTEFGLTANSEGSRQESWKRTWKLLNYCTFKGFSPKTFVNLMLNEGLHIEGCAPFGGSPAKEYLYFGKEPVLFTQNTQEIIDVLEGIGCWEFNDLEWYAFNVLNRRRKNGEEEISFSEGFQEELREWYHEYSNHDMTQDYGRKNREDFSSIGDYFNFVEQAEEDEPKNEYDDTRWDYNELGGFKQGRELAEVILREKGFLMDTLRDAIHLDKSEEAEFWFERARVAVERVLIQCGDLYEVDHWNEEENLPIYATSDVWKVLFSFRKADELGKRKELKLSFNKVVENYLDSLVEETEEELAF